MPLDPEISLGIQVPQPASGAANPLGMLNTFSEVQNRLNQNLLFQQQFAAKQRAGQIMASSPDLETGFSRLWQDPSTAAWAGPIINDARTAQKTLLDMQHIQQDMNMSGFQAVMKSAASAFNNPEMLPAVITSNMKTLSPETQKSVGSAMGDVTTALTSGLDWSTPDRANLSKSLYQSRMMGMMLGTGMSADQMRAAGGSSAPGTVSGDFGTGGAPAVGGVGSSIFGVPASIPGTINAGGRPLMGLPAEASASATAAGKLTGDLASEMSTMAKNLPEDLYRINTMADALGQMRSGGGANFRASLAKALQSFKNAGLGIDQKLIDQVGNENLASSQVFDANVRPLVIGELKQAAQGTGKVMRSEVDAFLSMMDKTIDPEAIRTLLNQAMYQSQVGYDQTQKYTEFKQKIARGAPDTSGLDHSDFYPWYNKQFDNNKMTVKTPGGLDFSPIPAERIKGASPAPATPARTGNALVPPPVAADFFR